MVRSTIAHTPVDENTVLFFENRKSLGKVGFSFVMQNVCGEEILFEEKEYIFEKKSL